MRLGQVRRDITSAERVGVGPLMAAELDLAGTRPRQESAAVAHCAYHMQLLLAVSQRREHARDRVGSIPPAPSGPRVRRAGRYRNGRVRTPYAYVKGVLTSPRKTVRSVSNRVGI